MASIHVGIDIAAETFTASYLRGLEQGRTAKEPFANSAQGIASLIAWLRAEGVEPAQARFALEHTGVYGELLSYELHRMGYEVSLLHPRALKQAFGEGPKNDFIDSRRIAEYAIRFADKIRIWKPRDEIVEQIGVLLNIREQLVEQKTALLNSRKALTRKVYQTPAANRVVDDTITHLKARIEELMEEIERLIAGNPTIHQGVLLLLSAPGVGWLLSAHFVVITRGFTDVPNYRTLAQFLGIAPNQNRSGTSKTSPDRSRRHGPPTLRKLLHLAARSRITHSPASRRYYLEKLAQGKPKRLVLNNVANKMIKQLCAMLSSKTSYVPGHRSVNPRVLALA